MKLIGLGYRLSSGKDEVARMLQYIKLKRSGVLLNEVGTSFDDYMVYKTLIDKVWKYGVSSLTGEYLERYKLWQKLTEENISINRFGTKMKEQVADILNCPVEKLEDRVWREMELGEEWSFYELKSADYQVKFASIEDHARSEFAHLELDTKKKYYTPRTLMVAWGHYAGRNVIHQNLWVNLDLSTVNVNSAVDAIFPNVRYPNEFKGVKDKGGVLVKVYRPLFLRLPIDIQNSCDALIDIHSNGGISDKIKDELTLDVLEYMYPKLYELHASPSEHGLDHIPDSEWDYVVRNDSNLFDLFTSVYELYTKIYE